MSKVIGSLFLITRLEPQDGALVRLAARQAGIPEEYVRDVRDLDAFKRAMRALVERGIAEEILDREHTVRRDKIRENEDRISFQLSARYLGQRRVKYSPADVITYNKNTGALECANSEIQRELRSLFNECMQKRSSTDINKVAYRYLDSRFKRLIIKDGVHFVPIGYDDELDRVRAFYSHLGASFWLQPVGSSADDIKNVTATLIDDIKRSVFELQARMNELKSNTRRHGVTPLIARNMYGDLRHHAARYEEHAKSIGVDLNELFAQAEFAGEALKESENTPQDVMAKARRGKKFNAFVLELAAAAINEQVPVWKDDDRKAIAV